MDGLCHGPNVAARFQTINAVRQYRSRVTAGQYLSFYQMLQEGKCRGSIGDGNSLGTATEEVDHGYLQPVQSENAPAYNKVRKFGRSRRPAMTSGHRSSPPGRETSFEAAERARQGGKSV